MSRINRAVGLSFLGTFLTCLPATAQDNRDHDHAQAQSQDRHDTDTYRRHEEWKKGSRIPQEDWNRGEKVKFRANHLQRPPKGHEWRKVDGNYVLANGDGTIVSVRPSTRSR